jgi:nucleoid-associated protein YgaU
MLREIGAKDPAARAAKPEQFVDMSFVKELDSSGFVDRLYKTQPVAKAAPARTEPALAPAVASKPAPAPARVEPAPVPPAVAKSTAPAKTGPMEEKPTVAKTERPEASPAPVRPAVPTPQPVAATAVAGSSYVVEAGDNLTRIALKFYNSNYKWTKIFEANRDTLKNPNYIYIGQVLVIPPDDGR